MAARDYPTFNELIDADAKHRFDDNDFDDALWLLLVNRITSVESAIELPEPLWVYFASRYMEWEVGNGGFAQAAYNIPEWFQLAASAYQKLGLESAATLIERANRLVLGGENRQDLFTATEIGDLFRQFEDSELAALDSEIQDVGWFAVDARLEYVRSHRNAFSGAV